MKVREQRDVLVDRVRLLEVSFAVLLGAIVLTYWLVQGVDGSHYRSLADNNRLRKLPLRATRGLIFDREGDVLVGNVPSYNVLLDASRSDDPATSLEFAASILGRPMAELEAAWQRGRRSDPFNPVLIAEGLSLGQVARFGVATLEHPEFEIDASQLRSYRFPLATAHVVGYLGEINEQDLRESKGDLAAGDLVGKKGIEAAYDRRLRGEDGERIVVVDSRGRFRDEFERNAALAGRNLRLTLDLRLQRAAEAFFADKVGAAVALDPRNGEVLALVSSPAFDPNAFAQRLDRTEWNGILTSPHHPLENRVVQSTYSPGSIFKVVMAIAGLSERVVSDRDSVYCGGSTVLYNRRFRCWKRGGHGWVDLHAALKESCDVYFYQLGQKLGIERIADYARRFGFGRATGIDIGGERKGLVPDAAWSLAARGTPWYPGETVSVSIGQGPLLATPLQIAVMMAAIANGGYLVTPHLAADAEVPPPAPIDVDRQALARVRQNLWAVVNEPGGTGAIAKVEGLGIAGKTGTVQVVEQKTWVKSETLPFEQRDHAWFASFASLDDPRLVVVVFVEHGGTGSRAAAPLAKDLYEIYFQDDQRQLSTR